MSYEEILALYEQYNLISNKEIQMNKDGDHDIDLRQMHYQIDTSSIHSKSELNAVEKLNELINSKVELKNCQSKVNLFVEYSIDKNNNGEFEPSGILTSNADKWRFTVGLMTLEFDLEFLLYLYNNKELLGITTGDVKNTKKYKAYGLLVPIKDLFKLQEYY